MERRLSLGESPDQAAAPAGRPMFVPLLVSSLAIILAFMPLAISSTETGEYLRSLGIVMAIALLLSLVIGPHRTRGRAADGLVPRQGPLDPGAQGHLHRRHGCTAGNLRLVVHHSPQRADAAVRAPSAADGHRAVPGFQPGQYDGGCSTDQQGTGRREARSGDLQPRPVHG
ncbi:hypothetical protein G6F51_014009 [Rhizopus arrhizus]|uniref:Uncharacterized protein n=1 Tax=Rhizopus oryzae TaxID=64495 RepID=A0A9P6XPH6_RHIOR|nr:hypothetical protein G6F51_014009 [Rhizopus arrhizus]